jgi:predicted chitinase
MSTITDKILSSIMTHASPAKRAAALPVLNAVAAAYYISNQKRLAAWLATLAVESGELKYQEEIASGAAYEGRRDLGNTQKGDGRRFKGRGRIQITGRYNYQSYTDYLKQHKHLPFIDFIQNPTALANEPYATDSAGWFFAIKINANPLADKGLFLNTQVKVNGRNKKTGLPNHWPVRNAYYKRGLTVLPAGFKLDASPGALESVAEPVAEAPVKAPAKAPAKAPVKAPAKAVTKAPAKAPVKAASKPRVLKIGDKGPDVKAMQGRLIHYKYLALKGDDGKFGPATEASVKRLQKAHKITVDGKVGPVTRKILFD